MTRLVETQSFSQAMNRAGILSLGDAPMHANNGQESSLTLLEGTPVVDAGGLFNYARKTGMISA